MSVPQPKEKRGLNGGANFPENAVCAGDGFASLETGLMLKVIVIAYVGGCSDFRWVGFATAARIQQGRGLLPS